jgi:hypothetical protein
LHGVRGGALNFPANVCVHVRGDGVTGGGHHGRARQPAEGGDLRARLTCQ